MDFLTFINSTLKYILLSLSAFYIIFKMLNYNKLKVSRVIIIVISSIVMSFICSLLNLFIPSIISASILIFITGIVLTYLTENNFNTNLIIGMISYIISYILYLLSLLIVCMITEISFIGIPFTSPIIILLASFVDFFFIYKIFSLPRFKRGFSFLKNNKRTSLYGGIIFLVYFITAFLFSLFGIIHVDRVSEIIIVAMLLIYIATFIWIKRNITLDYQDRMKNRKIENLEKESRRKERSRNS